MFKNKDGSYNKIQLLIISLIVIIGIDVVLSSLFVSEDPLKLLSISLLIACVILIPVVAMGVFKKPKPVKEVIETQSIPELKKTEVVIPISPEVVIQKTPEVDAATEYFREESFKQIPQPPITPYKHSSGSGIGIVSIMITIVMAAVTMVVGLGVVGTLQSALPALPESSPMNTQMTEVTNTVGSAFTILPLVIAVMGILFIIVTISGLSKGGKY